MITRFKLGAALLSMAVASAAQANILVNGGLESPAPVTLPDNLIYTSTTTNTSALPGWTVVSGSVDVVPNTYFANTEGSYSVDLVGTPGVGEISQTFSTVLGTTYQLTFDLAFNPEAGPVDERPDTKRLLVSALGADGSTLLTSQEYDGTAGTRTNLNMQYSQQTFTFVADGSTATLALQALVPLNLPVGLSAANMYTGPVIDNLDLEATGGSPAPEPASLGLLGLGGILLLKKRVKA